MCSACNLRELIGYKIDPINSIWDVGGIITYGGTGSNATAMLLARENFKKDTMKNGVNNAADFKIVIPKGIGHYSIRSSSMWIGCGDNIIEVPTKNYRYDLACLEETLIKYKGKIMCVVAYIGDSRTMSIENLQKVHELVRRIDKNIWLHADACHGFSLAFSEKLKSKITGIELFDSISTDPHKVLNRPYCVSALLIKNPCKFNLIASTSDLIMKEDFAWGQITPFIGSKSWNSLKIWFLLKNLGIKRIGEVIEKRCDIAMALAHKIKSRDDFILINDVDINSVVFMYRGEGLELDDNRLNFLNKEIHHLMLNEGKYHLHSFTLNDDNGAYEKNVVLTPLRYMSGNPTIQEIHLDELLNYIVKLGKKVIHNNEYM